MALIRFTLNNKRIGFVKNHKTGSTTVLNYIGQIFWNELPHHPTGTELTTHLGKDSYYGREKSFDYYKDKLLECDIRISTYRDPVKKLLSGFTLSKKANKIYFLDDFLQNYAAYMKRQNYIRIHCRTSTEMLGKDKTIYTHLFKTEEINSKLKPLLEQWSGKKLKETWLRKDEPVKITPEQEEKIKSIMKVDYDNGWF
tara:strand:+ start:604 stop:1197 length:594 start_codon:yes stop_codon:yes gene_type:complete